MTTFDLSAVMYTKGVFVELYINNLAISKASKDQCINHPDKRLQLFPCFIKANKIMQIDVHFNILSNLNFFQLLKEDWLTWCIF